MNKIKSKVMTIANKLVGKGYSRSVAMVKAWVLAKTQSLTTKVAGVTFDGRQELLQLISSFNPANVSISLKREPNNSYDKNAVAVWVSVTGKLNCKIGYLPKTVAYVIAPLLDKGNELDSKALNIVGGYEQSQYSTYGARIQLQI